MAWQVLRTIVEELDVENLVEILGERYPRFDEAWVGLKWLLSRNPTPQGSARRSNDQGREYRTYVSAGDEVAKVPDIWVVYTFTADEVVVLGVTVPDEPAKVELPEV